MRVLNTFLLKALLMNFLDHLRLNDMDNFKKTYRSLDLLLIDDIQSLSGNKVQTQDEFSIHLTPFTIIISRLF